MVTAGLSDRLRALSFVVLAVVRIEIYLSMDIACHVFFPPLIHIPYWRDRVWRRYKKDQLRSYGLPTRMNGAQ